jgi:hypothetical protein
MGLERHCEARIDGRRVNGLAHLDATELRFAGDVALRIPLGAGVRATADGSRLDVVWPGGRASFELGADAATFALKIRYPRSRLDKLGVGADMSVAIVGLKDAGFDDEVRERTSRVSFDRIPKGSSLAIVAVQALSDLDALEKHRRAIAEDGAIWVVWPKGRKALTETHVRAAAKAHGLVDVKVMSFSDELSALKLMVPRALRASGSDKASKSAAAGRPSRARVR